ncbi:MAG: DUF4339 domain-containing protein [Proteobacteria bacterium]|nr:DUF4339 domain-containing protein [Pseudomonadota bacterium]
MLLKKDKYHYTIAQMAEDKKYYLNINDQNVGPLSFDDITNRLKNGLLSVEDHIFASDSELWTLIQEIPEFAQYSSKIPEEEKKIWFLRKNKENIGPISKKEILNLLLNVEIDNNDYVWRKGLGNWMQLKDIYELKATKDIVKKIEIDGKKTLDQMPKQVEEIKVGMVNVPNINPEPEAEIEEPVIKKEKKQLPTRGPLELIERKVPEEETMKESLPTTEEPQKDPDKPLKPHKKFIPEFIFGIILILFGGYQINNNLIIGSTLVVIGILLILIYVIANRKKGTKNASDK